MKKDLLVKIIVNNSGLEFEDDVSLVLLTVDSDLNELEVMKKITDVDNTLRNEDEDGECLYNERGWNAYVLMDEVCEKYGWSWESLNPNIEFTI